MLLEATASILIPVFYIRSSKKMDIFMSEDRVDKSMDKHIFRLLKVNGQLSI